MFEKEGLGGKVISNIVSEMPTTAVLIPAVATGAADVALAWNTDAQAESSRLDVVRIDSRFTKAVQPIAIGRFIDRKELARRLMWAILASRPRFEAAGFGWRLSPSRISEVSKTPEIRKPRFGQSLNFTAMNEQVVKSPQDGLRN